MFCLWFKFGKISPSGSCILLRRNFIFQCLSVRIGFDFKNSNILCYTHGIRERRYVDSFPKERSHVILNTAPIILSSNIRYKKIIRMRTPCRDDARSVGFCICLFAVVRTYDTYIHIIHMLQMYSDKKMNRAWAYVYTT